MSGLQEFERQLRELGVVLDVRDDAGRVSFVWTVPVGNFINREIRLGFDVPGDFNLTPPGGPHLCPRLIPINPSAPAHPHRAHESKFGPDWQYWSRPFPNWNATDRTVNAYFAHIRNLFATT